MATATVTRHDLDRKYTVDERDAMLEAALDLSMAGNSEEATLMLRKMPINPRWAKIIADVMGKEYLREHFNITYANEVFGEGWLDAK